MEAERSGAGPEGGAHKRSEQRAQKPQPLSRTAFRRREREKKPAAFLRIDKHLLEDWEAALS